MYVHYRSESGLRFEWDTTKNIANQRKHSVSFEEATSVFYDDQALLIRDDGTYGEERFLLLGVSAAVREVVVCRCYRESDEVIRIVNARRANRSERTQYRLRWTR